MAVLFAFVPLKYLILFVFLEAFTREMPYRRESSYRWLRRFREWWFRIPAAPVQLIRADPDKKKKWFICCELHIQIDNCKYASKFLKCDASSIMHVRVYGTWGGSLLQIKITRILFFWSSSGPKTSAYIRNLGSARVLFGKCSMEISFDIDLIAFRESSF